MFDEILIKEMSPIDAYKYGRQTMEKELNEIHLCECNKVRTDTIDECADKFADILSNIPGLCVGLCPVKCNWGTEENCKTMCKKWLLERLKEQNNG